MTSLYDNFVPILANSLEALEDILTRAETHAKENNIDVNAEYAPARLIEDMLPLTFQVQTVSNAAKSFYERVAGTKLEVWKDDETTFEQLFARVKKTRELLKGVKPEDVNGKEQLMVEVLVQKSRGAILRSELEILTPTQEGWAQYLRDNSLGLYYDFCHTESLFPPSDDLRHSSDEGRPPVQEGLSLGLPDKGPGLAV